MELRTVGVEEELVLVDPETREATPAVQQVLKYAAEHARVGELEHELFQHQLETRTPPTTDLGELRTALVAQRRLASEAAAGAGVQTAATGAVPVRSGEPRPTRDDRYLTMLERFGEVARPGGTCGMHVHVAIASAEEGVRVLDALAPWLPVLLAITANSPFHHGRDTAHASWRSQLWSRWPSAGPTEPFGTVANYHEVGRRLIASGAARDEAMLYYDARLSRTYPTVEVRVSDVCTDPDDAVLVAALSRALVEHTAAHTGEPAPYRWRVEMLRAAHWRASRFGLGDRLLDPVTGDLAPAREVVDRLVATVGDELAAAGDDLVVAEGVRRVLAGNGSARQRAAYERNDGDLRRVVDDLVGRTNAAWHSPAG